MHTDFKALCSKCKKLGYTVKQDGVAYILQPIKRGMVLRFDNKADLMVWIKYEAEYQSNDYYLMDWSK